MINVEHNLIPEPLQQRRLVKQVALFWGALLIALLVGIGLYLVREHQLASGRAEVLQRLKQRAAPAQQIAEQIALLRDRHLVRQQQWQQVSNAIRPDDHLQALGVIASSIAEADGRVRLQSVDLQTEFEKRDGKPDRPYGRATLHIRVHEDVAAARFVQSLKQSPRMRDVTLRSTANAGAMGDREVEIIATFSIRGGVL